MANYQCKAKTNYFSVTNEEEYRKLTERLRTNSDEIDFFAENGKHCFGAYDSIYYRMLPSEHLNEDDGPFYDKDMNKIEWEDIDDYDIIYISDKSSECDVVIFDNDEYDDLDEFISALQKILPDGEVFVYQEIGYEKLRYFVSFAIIATNKEAKTINFKNSIVNTARELSGNPNLDIKI